MGMTKCPRCGKQMLSEHSANERRCLNISCMAKVYHNGSISYLIFENNMVKEIKILPDESTEIVKEYKYSD